MGVQVEGFGQTKRCSQPIPGLCPHTDSVVKGPVTPANLNGALACALFSRTGPLRISAQGKTRAASEMSQEGSCEGPSVPRRSNDPSTKPCGPAASISASLRDDPQRLIKQQAQGDQIDSGIAPASDEMDSVARHHRGATIRPVIRRGIAALVTSRKMRLKMLTGADSGVESRVCASSWYTATSDP